MKLNHKKVMVGLVTALSIGAVSTSCTDTISFGNAFLDKAPGADATIDTIFTNAEYTRRFVTTMYRYQYYGLPYRNSTDAPHTSSWWAGMFEALSDCWQLYYASSEMYKHLYSGSLSATSGNTCYEYKRQWLFETIRYGYILMDNIDRCTEMEPTERKRLVAEAKCLMAQSYFNMFRFYGGLPIIKQQYTGKETEYAFPRGTVEETVNHIVGLLDEAINTSELPFAYTGAEADTETGRWTKGSAMALKIKVLQFAASPLFNNDKPYYNGESEAEKQHLVWYGNYDKSRWTRLKTACEEFFNANAAAGNPYHLVEPKDLTGNRIDDQEKYRHAYREGYIEQGSPEVIHAVRPTERNYWVEYSPTNIRFSYCPTQEYVEMFPWADGTPFSWSQSEALPDKDAKSLQHMFIQGDTIKGLKDKNGNAILDLQNRVLTRDPRLYETVGCTGVPQTSDMTTGKMSGTIFENWNGGTTAGSNPSNESGGYATGYIIRKYWPGSEYKGYKNLKDGWAYLRYDDMLLTYAEALLQADDDLTGCLKYIDMIRERVGLKGLAECNPSENLTTNKENLLNELLRERACELGFEGTRYTDIVRYKLIDRLKTPLHGLIVTRKFWKDGKWEDNSDKWEGGQAGTSTSKKYGQALLKKNPNADATAYYEPTYFSFKKFTINKRRRAQWDSWDNKWLLMPFPNSEVLMGYGLIQNPGW